MPAARQRGLSLVELLVGIAVGMFVVAAAATLAATQLVDNRRMLLEVQLQQDMRATLDIVTRELRRSGACCSPSDFSAVAGAVARVESPPSLPAAMAAPTPANGSSDDVTLFHGRRLATAGPHGFRLDDDGVLIMRIPGFGSVDQPLTDTNLMEIVEFSVTAVPEDTVQVPCPKLCAGGGTACWPTVTTLRFDVQLQARSRADAAVVRTMRSSARVRNDRVEFNTGSATESCPT